MATSPITLLAKNVYMHACSKLGAELLDRHMIFLCTFNLERWGLYVCAFCLENVQFLIYLSRYESTNSRFCFLDCFVILATLF